MLVADRGTIAFHQAALPNLKSCCLAFPRKSTKSFREDPDASTLATPPFFPVPIWNWTTTIQIARQRVGALRGRVPYRMIMTMVVCTKVFRCVVRALLYPSR